MEITLNTPALLFPAISLVMLAYTNRFMALSSVVRTLHERYKTDKENALLTGQISNLRYRIVLVRRMQFCGVSSFIFGITCMCLIMTGQQEAAKVTFIISIVFFAASLLLSLLEILKSTKALELELSDMEEPGNSTFTSLLRRRNK